jgi:uncharacterized protein (DUF2147 family)
LGLTLIPSCLWTSVAYCVDATSPVGLWKTVDDKTGTAGAVVQIYESNGRLFGKIVQIFKPGAQSQVCVACSDERKGQPIIGLVIIRGIKPGDGDYFSGGDILDPDSGTIYRCKFHLDQQGSVLIVRGYIGFSLLGRSQTWHRL